MKQLTFPFLLMLFSLLAACDDDEEVTGGGTVVTDDALIEQADFNTSAIQSFTVVPCNLEDGSTSECYQLTFSSNNVPDDGPFCPSTTSETGGLGFYNGLKVMNAALWTEMENDGYDLVDNNGNVTVQDPAVGGGSGSACLQATADDNLTLTFLIPTEPKLLGTPNTIESVELIGVSLDGVPINGEPPAAVGGGPGGGGGTSSAKLPALDPCGGHHDPSGYYHWHFGAEAINQVFVNNGITEVSCTNITQSATALIGFAKDGYPIYSYQDASGMPTDLDDCQGHTGTTPGFTDAVYHYHVSTSTTPNLPPCIVGVAAANNFRVQ